MKDNIVPGYPKKGMNRDSAAFDLSKEEYSFALNANIQDEHGNGSVNLQNEPSNIKCSGFKNGYKVIGHKYHLNKDRTYFFLTNPTTGYSEIGYINSFRNHSELTPIEQLNSEGNIVVQLETPLENVIQVEECAYVTLVSDYCEDKNSIYSKCLNFSIDHPIKGGNVIIKNEKIGDVMYFTDGYNPQRYLKLDYIEDYFRIKDDCTNEVTDTCFQCDKIRIFPLFITPCLKPKVLATGGNLRMGTYEVLVALSDASGNERSDYYSLTNAIPIFDKNNRVLDQTLLDSETPYSIIVDVKNIDTQFDYYKIAVIYRSGLDGAVTVYSYGIFPYNQSSITINNLKGKAKISLSDIIFRSPSWETAKGFATNSGYLFQYDLTAKRTINLQPIFNLIGGFAKWVTVNAPENLYENGVFVSNYGSYMRGEVYPIGIKLITNTGQDLPLSVLIPRPASASEILELGNGYASDSNNASVLASNLDCSVNERNKRWQFEDTSIDYVPEDVVCIGNENEGVPTETEFREVESSCVLIDEDGEYTEVDFIASGCLEYDETLDIVDYINSNLEGLKTVVPDIDNPCNGSDIAVILNNVASYGGCSVNFDKDCGKVELKNEEVFAIGVEGESSTFVDFDLTDYKRLAKPTSCTGLFAVDTDGTSPFNDSAFVSNYMSPSDIVYKRVNPSNNDCDSAITPYDFEFSIGNCYLQNLGGSSASSLQTSKDSSKQRNHIHYKIGGTNGSLLLTISGVGYTLSYSGSITTSIDVFIADNSATILSAHNCILKRDGNSLVIIKNDYTGTIILTSCTNAFGDMSADFFVYYFSNKVHKNAVWYKADLSGVDSKILELSNSLCGNKDSNTYNAVRVTFFKDCNTSNDVASNCIVIDDITTTSDEQLTKIIKSNYSGDIVYLAVDSMIIQRDVNKYTLAPPCGCFNIYLRDVEQYKKVTYDRISFGKRQTYVSTCPFTKYIPSDCLPSPHKKGEFAYWESTERYPCNNELYNSSELVIPESMIPSAYKTEFINHYSTGNIIGGNIELDVNKTNFMDKPIRHYKFPTSLTSPFMNGVGPGYDESSRIFPIGFFIPNEIISAFLDIAVFNGLLTQSERDSIVKYEVFRGDRRNNKSIIAKGLAYDVYRYFDVNSKEMIFYPNYPLNTLGKDNFNQVPHPYNSLKNDLFTFHSPETSFEKPSLTREMLIEGYMFGNSRVQFDEVDEHPRYVVLGKKAIAVAETLAYTEALLDATIGSLEAFKKSTESGTLLGAAASLPFAVLITTQLSLRMITNKARYSLQWKDTMYNLGKPNNFAYYSTSIGYYNVFKPNSITGSRLRGLQIGTYIDEGKHLIKNEYAGGTSYLLNNMDRERSVFLKTGVHPIYYPADYSNYDNVDTNMFKSGRFGYTGISRSKIFNNNTAAPYVTLKDYRPNQYGSIGSIRWVFTGHCELLSNKFNCKPVFGGDVTISRFSLKRKLPFFNTTAMGQADNTPFKYSDYFNINPPLLTADAKHAAPRFFLDYRINEDNNLIQALFFPGNDSVFNFDADKNTFYKKPPSKFYLYSYGIPYFLVESEINSNFRYSTRFPKDDFYPNVGDVLRWTQEVNVSIREPNNFLYNRVYSFDATEYPREMLSDKYSRKLFDNVNNYENFIIYSNQDNSETDLADSWLSYKPNNSFQFSSEFGKLISVLGIESEKMLAKFTNGVSIFGSIDVLKERIAPENRMLGAGGIFASRTVSFNKTELGHAGSQHYETLSCEFGHFWADARRGKIFQLLPNGEGLHEISKSESGINNGLEKWFKEHLPFKILNYFPDLSLLELDNNYKGLGISMGWDDRTKRVFFTKLDYVPTMDSIYYSDGNFYETNKRNEDVLSIKNNMISLGWSFYKLVKHDLVFRRIEDGKYVYKNVSIPSLSFTDSNYFRNASWTIAYNPMLKSWISYYSFKPNYYVSYNDYFQTGINYSDDNREFGLWSHLPFISSYQVFYGKLYPFTIEYPVESVMSHSVLSFVQYYLDVRKYYNKHNYTNMVGTGFNKAVIYNDQQNSGLLNLTVQEKNDIRQNLDYPRYNANSIDILQTEINGKFTFNYFYNLIKEESAGLPIFLHDINDINKVLDDRLLDYRYNHKDRLRGDYFTVRLTNDKESRFKFIFRLNLNANKVYNQ
jgi:hypothetical protein